ncbi:MAG: cupin domain-containing protein [Phycisphaerae bacterium]
MTPLSAASAASPASPPFPLSIPLVPASRFSVLGDQVELLVTAAQSNGSCVVLAQSSEPGSGPPPHVHANEDEFFQVLEGEFELFSNGQWKPLKNGEFAFCPRNIPHTFRNAGTSCGKILCVAVPGRFQYFLEELSRLSAPADMPRIIALAESYGIKFLL